MSVWVTPDDYERIPVDLEVAQEAALAIAQATIQRAITTSGIRRAEMANRMGRPRSFISRMLSGHHNLTVKTLGRALAACGYEASLDLKPISWGWVRKKTPTVAESHSAVSVSPSPAQCGQFRADPSRAGSELLVPIGNG